MAKKEKKENKNDEGLVIKAIRSKDKGLIAEFRKFITRGNVLELAVGVILGGAFTAIVNALSNKIIMPLINTAIYWTTGGTGISLVTILNGEPRFLEDGVTLNSKCIYIDWGTFIQVIIDFFLIAIILFALVKGANTIADKKKAYEDKQLEAFYSAHPEQRPAPEVKKPTEVEILGEIRDLLKEEKK